MHDSKTIGEILTLVDEGEHINNSQLLFAIDILNKWMKTGLDTLGPRYSLFISDLRRRLDEFNGYAKHRNLQ